MKSRVFFCVLSLLIGVGCKDKSSKSTNSPPVLNAIGSQTVAADSELQVDLSATDPDPGQLHAGRIAFTP